jgi:hypothetical protein
MFIGLLVLNNKEIYSMKNQIDLVQKNIEEKIADVWARLEYRHSVTGDDDIFTQEAREIIEELISTEQCEQAMARLEDRESQVADAYWEASEDAA